MRVDHLLSEFEFPEISAVKEFPSLSGKVLITAQGFEHRSCHVFKQLISQTVSDSLVISIKYLPERDDNVEISDLVSETLIWPEIEYLYYDRQRPNGIADKVLEIIPVGKEVFIDISGMSRLLIVQLVVGLIRCRTDLRVTVFYTEAKKYYPTKEEFVKEHSSIEDGYDSATTSFLSEGIFSIASPPELTSSSFDRLPIHLITFPTFNPMQLKGLLNLVQPSVISLLYSQSPKESWRKEAVHRINKVRDITPTYEDAFLSSDYAGFMKWMLTRYAERAAFEQLVIVPTGSKLLSLSIGLMRAFISDIQVIYPTPRSYVKADRYNEGIGATYSLSLDSFLRISEKLHVA